MTIVAKMLRRGWRTPHLVGLLLCSAMVMVALALFVGLTSDARLRSAVDTNSEIAELRRRVVRVEGLAEGVVLAARQPPSAINTADLIERRVRVIEGEIDSLVTAVAIAERLPTGTALDSTLERRLTTALAAVEEHAVEALSPGGTRADSLVLLDVSYGLLRDDLLRFEEALEDQGGSELQAQAAESGRLSQIVLVVAVAAMASTALAAVVGLRLARRESEMTELLRSQAMHDPLTALINRRALLELLDSETSTGSVLAFVDVDHFKRINDSLGHSVGDEVLRSIAERLAVIFPPPNAVARLGGDEFAVVAASGDANSVAAQVQAAFATPIEAQGEAFELTASIGVRHLDPGLPGEEALRQADIAMYQAKADPTRSSGVFVEADADVAERSMRTESRLRQALRREELEVWYQPLIGTTDDDVVGCEALVRWRHEGQIVSPGEFLPIAEALGLMPRIDDLVLRLAARDIAAINAAADRPLRVSVNLHSASLRRAGVVEGISSVLETTSLRAEWLMLEVTEQAAIEHVERAGETLESLRRLGVRTAIDDFGCGYSSLGRLDDLPFDVVKVDRSLLPLGLGDERRTKLFDSVVQMARGLGYDVVSEGVETPRQTTLARAAGCSVLQGFLYGKPMPLPEFQAWLDERNGASAVSPDPDRSVTRV